MRFDKKKGVPMGLLFITVAIIFFIIGIYHFYQGNYYTEITRSGQIDPVQLGILIAQLLVFLAIAYQGHAIYAQNQTIKDHFKIQRQPVVVVSDIEPTVMANENLQEKIDKTDEFIIKVIFQNIGETPALVDYIRLKIFCGYFSKGREKLDFHLDDMVAERQKKRFVYDEEVPVTIAERFKDSVFSPNQKIPYTTMVNALELMNNIRSYTTLREAPIYIECEVHYYSIDRSETYWYNCIYELQWPKTTHTVIYSIMKKSNIKNEPLHLTYGELVSNVSERQKVNIVIDAIKNGDKDLQKIINFD
jgi:hypothetical protein